MYNDQEVRCKWKSRVIHLEQRLCSSGSFRPIVFGSHEGIVQRSLQRSKVKLGWTLGAIHAELGSDYGSGIDEVSANAADLDRCGEFS